MWTYLSGVATELTAALVITASTFMAGFVIKHRRQALRSGPHEV
jgi:hypothetical protein